MASKICSEYKIKIPTNFSEYVWNFEKNLEFEFTGFNGIHKAANSVLHYIFPDVRNNFQGIRLNPDDFDIKESNFDSGQIVKEFTSTLVFAGFGVLVALVLQIALIIWCFCSCSSCRRTKKRPTPEFVAKRFTTKNGTHNSKFPKKKSLSKRNIAGAFLAFLLFILILAFLIGLIITSRQLGESIAKIPNDFDLLLEDAEVFISKTSLEIVSALVGNFKILSNAIKKHWGCDGSGNFFNQQGHTFLLQLQNSRSAILGAAQEIEKSGTREIYHELADIFKYPDLNQSIHSDDDVCKQVDEVQQELERDSKEMTDALSSIPLRHTREELRVIERQFKRAQTAAVAILTGIFVYLLVLLIAFGIGSLGMLMRSSRKIASISTNCGLFVLLITAWIPFAIVIALFVVSGSLAVVLPGVIYNIAENGSIVNNWNGNTKIDQISVRNNDEYTVAPAPFILRECRNDSSAYEAFMLEQVYDVDELDEIREIFLPISKSQKSLKRMNHRITELKQHFQKSTLFNREDKLHKILFSTISDMENEVVSELGSLEELKEHVECFVEFAKIAIRTTIGKCSPVLGIFHGSINIYSYKIGSPIGAYWISLNILLWFFFPIIIGAITIQLTKPLNS